MSADELLTVKIDAECVNRTKTVINKRGFEVVIDEPEPAGGTDDGPNPTEYLLSTLAGCLNVVGHKVADDMNLDLTISDISLEGEVDTDKVNGISMAPRAGFQEIRAVIDLETDEDDATVREWRELLEERCIITENLRNETPVTVSTD